MGKLRLSRGNEWFCMALDLNVYIDDDKIGIVAYNDYTDFSLSEGHYHLQVKVGGFKSKKIRIKIENDRHSMFWVELPHFLSAPFVVISAIWDNEAITLKPISTDTRA